ncbi:hypothetical protein [Oceanomicrobium pacificus]|uniref:Glycine zipper domain-containing protein n=1 Tax=Oceanomicrobium pacificus TaxID=2692916 RepID=A0A6B0TQ86_9RHOB|nr:hypothetical protein [Oceanomicrobium pacificus]MXU66106.1 hypothetical protein [Oceanomicrobium pacificus]
MFAGRILPFLLAGAMLAGCGTETGDRALTGAAIGGASTAVLGPGALIGAGVGGVVGAVTEPDDIYLGKPVYK